MSFTPIVEIDCKDADGPEHWLTRHFAAAIEAELVYGQRVAKEWMDEQIK